MSEGRSTRHIYRQGLVRTIRERGGVLCHICGKQITSTQDLTIDHIIPKSRGGTSKFENLQPAHSKCNSLKKNWILPTLRLTDMGQDK